MGVCMCVYLAARLVRVEVAEAANGCDHVHALIKHGHGGGAQSRSFLLQVVEVHEHLQHTAGEIFKLLRGGAGQEPWKDEARGGDL